LRIKVKNKRFFSFFEKQVQIMKIKNQQKFVT